MSKIKLEGNASGTGTLTISAPSTNTDRTLTLPDGAGEILLSDGDGSNLTGIEGLPDAIDVNASAPADSLNIASNGSLTVKPNIAKATDTATLLAQIGTNDASDPLAIKFTARTGQGSNNYIAMDCAEGTTNRDFVIGYNSTEHFRIKSDGRGISSFTAQAWVTMDGENTLTALHSHNVSSLTDNGTGDYIVNFSNNMSHTDYCVVMESVMWSSGYPNRGIQERNASNTRVFAQRSTGGSMMDVPYCAVAVFANN